MGADLAMASGLAARQSKKAGMAARMMVRVKAAFLRGAMALRSQRRMRVMVRG